MRIQPIYKRGGTVKKSYIVYAKANASGCITAINSSAFLSDKTGWMEIDSGYGDKYHHAQGNYFPQAIITDGGAYRYKLVDGVPVECTAEEIAQQEAEKQLEPSVPDAEPSIWDELAAAYSEGVQSA